MTGISGAADDVRATVTLGTPFDGAAKAALVLAGPGDGSSGSCVDRVRREFAAAARTMPGVYDLLPAYRCVDTGDDVRPLGVGDVAALGGDCDHATTAEAHRAARRGLRLPGHHALIGVEQPTMSSLRLDAGIASGTRDTFQLHADGELIRDEHGRLARFPGHGDGTVPRNSARPRESAPMVLGQQHTTLAQSDEAITFVRDVVVHGRAPDHPRLADGAAGLDVPDLVTPSRMERRAVRARPAPCTGDHHWSRRRPRTPVHAPPRRRDCRLHRECVAAGTLPSRGPGRRDARGAICDGGPVNCDPEDKARSIRFTPIAIGSYADRSLTPLDVGERTVDTEVRAIAAAFAEFGGMVVDWDVAMADRRLERDRRPARCVDPVRTPPRRPLLGGARPPGARRPVAARGQQRGVRGSIAESRVAEALMPRERLGEGRSGHRRHRLLRFP